MGGCEVGGVWKMVGYARKAAMLLFFFFFNDAATTEIYTLSLHDALPICSKTSRSLLYGI